MSNGPAKGACTGQASTSTSRSSRSSIRSDIPPSAKRALDMAQSGRPAGAPEAESGASRAASRPRPLARKTRSVRAQQAITEGIVDHQLPLAVRSATQQRHRKAALPQRVAVRSGTVHRPGGEVQRQITAGEHLVAAVGEMRLEAEE